MRHRAIRDVGRALNVPYAEVDNNAKLGARGPGALHITLEQGDLKLSNPLKDLMRDQRVNGTDRHCNGP